MTQETSNKAPAPEAFSAARKPESGSAFLARLRDPKRWKTAVVDLVLWFMFGIIVTTLIGQYTPGYPIVVGTPSIPRGLYWLDKEVHDFSRGDYVTFSFEPTQTWLQGRYGRELVHTKQVLGVAGDVVKADEFLNLTLCQNQAGHVPHCVPAGTVHTKDSKGRPLYSWVPANTAYTLKPGELWVWAPHPLSLDSRYHGPVQSSAMHGKATPLLVFGGQ